jgi:predicted nucleotidyltransferase
MDLSDDELSAIARWAEDIPWISEVWLFGSRSRGDAREDSDVDVVVTITSSDRGNTPAGIYNRCADFWQRSATGCVDVSACNGTQKS